LRRKSGRAIVWRRVRLPDGSVAYLLDSAISKPAVEPPFPSVPATVTVFELRARERANEDAPVAGTFSEGAQLKVSKERVHGWRRVLLDDGNTAFVEEKGLKLPPELDEPPRRDASPAEARTSPSPKPNIFVKDLDHLAQLVKPDPLVYPEAARIADRRSTAIWTMVLTGIGGSALWVSSMTVLAHDGDCVDGICEMKPNWLAFIVGATVAAVGPLVGFAMIPSRSDVLDVMNRWNVRHPDEQFTWGSGVSNRQ
jgi:hypothetical protein